MKVWKKALSVGLSLTLCAGLVVPSYALACLNDVDDNNKYLYIDEASGKLKSHEVEGEDGETVQSYDYYLSEDLDLNNTLTVTGKNVEASIDLNGYTLWLNKDMTVEVDGKNVAVKGKVENGSVVEVTAGAELTVYGNKDEKDYDKGEGTGAISGGTGAKKKGGGVTVTGQGSTFKMYGGEISNNAAMVTSSYGGGLYAWDNSEVYLEKTTIKNNGVTVKSHHGGGIAIDGSTATIKECTIENNAIDADRGNAGGVWLQNGELTIEKSKIQKNYGPFGGGLVVQGTSTLIVNETDITGNRANYCGAMCVAEKSKVVITGGKITENMANYESGCFLMNGGLLVLENCDVSKNTEGGKEKNWHWYTGNESIVVIITEGETSEGTVEFSKNEKTLFVVEKGKVEVKKVMENDTMTGAIVSVDKGAKITGEKTETTFPDGVKITVPECEITGATATVTKTDKGNDTVTIETNNGKDGDEAEATTTVITLPDGKTSSDVTVDDEGTTTIPEGSTAIDKYDEEIELPYGGTIDRNGNVTIKKAPEKPADDNGNGGTTPGSTGGNTGVADIVGAADEGLTTIEAEAVPLAGLVSVEEVLEELYKHEGSPDGEDPEGEYDLAVAWAITNKIIDEDYDVEEIVTVAILRDILIKYIDFAGIEYTPSIDGEDDDIVDNCGEILTELFAADA